MFKHTPVDLGYADLGTVEKDGRRIYINEDGEEYPSITTVLSILSEAGIAAWRRRVGDEEADKIMTRASRRGTAVHEFIERYINNEPIEDIKKLYTPDVYVMFLQMKETLDERIGKVFAQECPLYSDHLRIAGRVDCVAEFDGKISIIDFKTSRKRKYPSNIKNYFQQEAGYAVMFEERTGVPVSQLVTIIAVDDQAHPQVFIQERDDWVTQLQKTIGEYRKRWNME